jgi:hypothetical protein
LAYREGLCANRTPEDCWFYTSEQNILLPLLKIISVFVNRPTICADRVNVAEMNKRLGTFTAEELGLDCGLVGCNAAAQVGTRCENLKIEL